MISSEVVATQNLQADYNSLLQDISEKSLELSALHKNIAELKAIQVDIDSINITTNKEIEQMIKKVHEDQNNIETSKKLASEEQKRADDKLSFTNKEIKDRVKELARTNSYVLAAQEELLKLTIDTSNANEQLKHLVVLVNKVEQTKLELEDLQHKKSVLVGEISTKNDELDSKLKSTTDKLTLMEARMVEIQTKASIAESTYKSYTDQLYTAMNDYQIVRTRLEEKWNKTFPELELPLMI